MTRASQSTTTCPYCGRDLVERYVEFGASRILIGHKDCTCKGAIAAKEAARKAEEQAALEAASKELERKLLLCGVPKRYLHASHDLAKKVASLVDDGKSAYVCGPAGTLKTTLAASVAIALISRGKHVEMVNAVDMLIALQGTYGAPRREEDVLAHYTHKQVLIIDDMGKEQQTAWSASRLYAIINARYNAMRPTIVTSNLSLAELSRRMSQADTSTAEAIASRLAGMCTIIQTSGPDRRLA